MRAFLIAFNFLTIVPLGREMGTNKKELAESALFFPLIGACIGLLLVAVDFLLRPIFPPLIVNLFVLLALLSVTGALHLDGFIDSIDGLFSGQDRSKMLEIMRDSRVGAFGVVAVIFLLLLKLSFLDAIQPSIRYLTLLLMPALARWAVVWVAWRYPYAREGSGTGEPFAKLVGKREIIGATFFMAVLLGLLFQLKGIIIWLGVFVVLFLLGSWINKKLGGMTGDTYGAVIETIELITLISVYCTNKFVWLP